MGFSEIYDHMTPEIIQHMFWQIGVQVNEKSKVQSDGGKVEESREKNTIKEKIEVT